MRSHRGSRFSRRLIEGRTLRPGLALTIAALAALLLIEVGQNSHMAELCLKLEKTHTTSGQVSARLDYLRAQLERRTTRAELAPLAHQLGLAPADARQFVTLPSEYLADGGRDAGVKSATPLLALAERASRVLVPEATARSRALD